MGKVKVLLIIVFISSIASVSNAINVVYVDVNSPNDPGTGTFDDPFRRIQDAIDTAKGGNIIEIQPGLYTGGGNYDLDPNGKSITIRSIDPNDPNIVAETIIDPSRAGRGFYFDSSEDANCIVAGLTIRNAYTGGRGGGIYCYRASPTIKNCTIFNNSSNMYGGGLYFQYSDSLITKCVISDNTAANDGGGIELSNSRVKITNCIFNSNQANSYGGGTDFFHCDAIVRNCTFVGNTANNGGGLYCWNTTESDITVSDCIFWENQATSNSQIGRTASGTVLVSYCNVQGTWPGTNNINTDPNFVSFDLQANPNTWDLRLKSQFGRWDLNANQWLTDITTSPCIDAGDPNSDYTNELWPHGKQINMGAYGGTVQASMSASEAGNISDLNHDGIVCPADLVVFTDSWLLEEILLAEDLSRNGFVNLNDFAIFAENWLWMEE